MNGSSATDLVRREAHHQVAAVVRGAAHRLLHHASPTLSNTTSTPRLPVCLEHDGREVGLGVVDRDVGAELAAQRHLLVGARGREHARAAVHGELDRRRSRAARRRRGSARSRRLAGRRGRRGRARRGGTGSTARPRRAAESCRASRTPTRPGRSRTRRSRRCAPFGIATTRRPCHASAPAPHASTIAHHLHARAVRQLGAHHHVAAGDALEIVQVERDRLHANEHLARLGLRNAARCRVGAPRWVARRTRGCATRASWRSSRMCNRSGPRPATGPRSRA